MKTYRTFTEALADDGIEVSLGQIARGAYANKDGDCYYQLINNNIRTNAYSNIEINEKQWIVRTRKSTLEKEIDENRTVKIYVSNQLRLWKEVKRERYQVRANVYSYRDRTITKSANDGIRFLGEFKITDFGYDADGEPHIVRTNTKYL